SDFDQRHNLVMLSVVDIPASRGPDWVRFVTRNWRFSELAAFRSGFPYSVVAASLAVPGRWGILNQRAALIGAASHPHTTQTGGRQLLDPANFGIPAAGQIGNTGRNAFRGPGLYNLDVSLARSFPVKYLGESGRLTVRVDAFNFLNHANLN